jgi:hypothetical protein
MNAALVFGFNAVAPNLCQTSRGRKTKCIPSAYVAMAGRTGPVAASFGFNLLESTSTESAHSQKCPVSSWWFTGQTTFIVGFR